MDYLSGWRGLPPGDARRRDGQPGECPILGVYRQGMHPRPVPDVAQVGLRRDVGPHTANPTRAPATEIHHPHSDPASRSPSIVHPSLLRLVAAVFVERIWHHVERRAGVLLRRPDPRRRRCRDHRASWLKSDARTNRRLTCVIGRQAQLHHQGRQCRRSRADMGNALRQGSAPPFTVHRGTLRENNSGR